MVVYFSVIIYKLSGGFGYTKRYGVVRILSLNQTTFKYILCYLIVNAVSFMMLKEETLLLLDFPA